MKILALEADAGISGDMLAAALLDLGADRQALAEALGSMPAAGFFYEISRVRKGGIDCCDFAVRLDAAHVNHDHDMEYLHGAAHEHAGENFAHEHEHAHAHACHEHEHRGLAEIMEIIAQTRMSEGARKLALRIFEIIAAAEAKAHAVPASEVHFHEVGALDSLVDVVAIAVCFDSLRIDAVAVPYLCEGEGTVRCQHGVLPVPVPAVLNIVQEFSLPLRRIPVQGEFVTPTGAAAAAALRSMEKLPHVYKVIASGYGAGKREYAIPSILRALLLESVTEEEISPPTEEYERDAVMVLETNIDDCTGEVLAFAMEGLLAAGALDVCYSPIFMKKNRPGYQLQVLCRAGEAEALAKIIFEETSTLGVRVSRRERLLLPRRQARVATEYGELGLKIAAGGKFSVEYEDAAAAARKSGVPLSEVFRAGEAALQAARAEGRGRA